MSAADFLLSPEVQKLLKVAYATPGQPLSAAELARRSKLEPDDAARTLEHLAGSGILKRQAAKAEQPETFEVDASFVFHAELRRIALKSFAAAEPVRAMLRSKFKDSVLRALLVGEDKDGSIELLVVHGELTPDEAAMTEACRKLSKSLGRHLKVHVVSSAAFDAPALRDSVSARLAAGSAFEIVSPGDTRARPPVERTGLLQSARKRLAMLSRPPR